MFLFVGDSFTAGEELLDYKYYKNYPSPVNFYQLNSDEIREWGKNNHITNILGGLELKKHNEDQKLLTYAHKISKIMGVPYINLAKNGTSLDAMYYNLVKYVTNSTEQDISVFVQPTSVGRWTEFINGRWQDFIFTNLYEKEIKNYVKFKVLNNTDHSRFTEWALKFRSIYDFCNNNTKIKNFYFINNGIFNYIESSFDVDDSFKIYYAIKQKIQDKIFCFPHTKNLELKNFLPGGHVIELNHEQLALDIKSIIA